MVSTELVIQEQKPIFNEILIGSYVKLSLAEAAILVGGRVIKYNSERDPTSDHSTKVWYKLSEHFKTKKN